MKKSDEKDKTKHPDKGADTFEAMCPADQPPGSLWLNVGLKRNIRLPHISKLTKNSIWILFSAWFRRIK